MRLNWQARAACAGTGLLDDFMGDSPSPTAVELCARCPVRDECLTHALENDEPGFWGGTSERARRRLSARSRADSRESTGIGRCPLCGPAGVLLAGRCVACGLVAAT